MIGIYLLYEAALRVADPQPVSGWIVVIIAVIALIVDAVTAALTYAMSKSSVNIRAAFLHNLADALGSIAVIVAGTLILLYDWRLIDPIVTVMIAGYILWQSFREIGPVIRILMLGSPPGIETEAVLDTVRGIDGVSGIHHAHFWQMDEHRAALEAHIVIAEGCWSDADAIKSRVKSVLSDRFDIEHTTLEMECARHACDAPTAFRWPGPRQARQPVGTRSTHGRAVGGPWSEVLGLQHPQNVIAAIDRDDLAGRAGAVVGGEVDRRYRRWPPAWRWRARARSPRSS